MAEALIYLASALAGIAFLLAIVRFALGPLAVDRVVAFDVLTIIAISGIVLAALVEDRVIYLDVALVYALLSFIAAGQYNPVAAVLRTLCEPLLRPFRRVIPPLGGLDLSPVFAIIALQALRMLLA